MKQFLFSILLFFSFQAFAGKNIILVPGFFSSAIPAPVVGGNPWKQPYFSQDIVKAMTQTGARIWVVDNLSPLASVEENGNAVIRFLRAHASEMQAEPLILIGHSAGGLYALYAAAHSNFPIVQIVSLSTPYQGLDFLQTLENQNIPVDSLLGPFCLENLIGLKQKEVQSLISTFQLKRPLRLDVFSAYQPIGLDVWNWQTMSTILVPMQLLNNSASDGIATVQSSLNVGSLLENNRSVLTLYTHRKMLPLEHWELVLDAKFSTVLGVTNVSSLRKAQTQVYLDVLKATGH